MFIIRYGCILFYFGVIYGQELSPIVTISDGQVQGTIRKTGKDGKTYYAYRGIPFAQKPVGDLRFAPPVQNEPWTGVLNATNDRDICTQVLTPEPLVISGSEDCLYINVYTTNLSKKLPVMVWIYGGSFIFGSSNYDTYAPDYILEKDVIYVSFNYRVGVFGFLSTEDLAAPGNWGLKDQILALKWVKKNIAKFGGDPNKVTIFGESAGAASISHLVNNPITKGLYGGAIMQSGTSLCVFALTRNAKRRTGLVAAELNITETNSAALIKRLRSVDNIELKKAEVAVTIKVFQEGDILGGEQFGVVREPNHPGAVVTGRTYEILKKGMFNRVPTIIGFNSNELGATLTEETKDVVVGILNLIQTPEVFAPYDLTGNVTKMKEAGNLVISHYLGPSPTTADAEKIYKYLTENHFNRPIRKTVNMMSRYSNVYYYEFSYEGQLGNPNRTIPGVHHAEDLAYLFYRNLTVSEKDALTVERIVVLWTNFAKTRNPTSSNRTGVLRHIKWKPNTPNTDVNEAVLYLNINNTLTMQQNPNQAEWLFYKNIYDTYGDPSYYTTY